jgi:hypothetical protein
MQGNIMGGLNDSIINEMIEESKTTDKEAVIRVVEPSENVDSYSIIYQNQSNKHLFDMSLHLNFQGNELNQPDKGQDIDKIKVRDFEAIYVKDRGRTDIQWIDSSKHILYSVGCPGGNVTKDELLKIAESLK